MFNCNIHIHIALLVSKRSAKITVYYHQYKVSAVKGYYVTDFVSL